MQLGVATFRYTHAEGLNFLVEPREEVGEALEQGLGSDGLDVGGDSDASGDEERLPMGRIDNEAGMLAREECLAEQFQG
jgi:hypothetical protein